MKKILTRGLLTTFIITVLLSVGLFIPKAQVSADAALCSMVEALIGAGVIAPDMADAARMATGCPTRPTPVTPVTPSWSATIVGTPNLELIYDSLNKEESLSASFKVQLTADGDSDLNIYQDANPVLFRNLSNENHNFYGSSLVYLGGSDLNTGQDQFGRAYYIIPAGYTDNFVVVSKVNPKVMFAGSYVAELHSLIGLSAGNAYQGFSINVPKNQTNNKTIVGEVSPYISSVAASTTSSGSLVIVNGVRMQNSIPSIVSTPGLRIWDNKNSTSGTSLQFMVNAPAGYYSVQVSDAVTGASNIASFSILSGVTSPLIITFPTAGSVLQAGQAYNITWTGSDPGVASYAIYLIGGKLGSTGSQYLGEAYPRADGTVGTFSWSIPADLVSASNYQIQFSGKGVTGGESGRFSIVAPVSSTNKPPVISGISAPTTLNVGETGTWSVQASDPEKGSLNYSVNWGDVSTAMSVASKSFIQSASFTHSYNSAGTFKPVFTVKDSAGLSAESSATVRVVADSSGDDNDDDSVVPPVQGPTAPALPSGLTSSCGADAKASVSWTPTPTATYYKARIDNQTKNGWVNDCSKKNVGDLCVDDVKGTNYSAQAAPGATYDWWIYACNAQGCSEASGGPKFTCPAKVSTETESHSSFATVLLAPFKAIADLFR